VLPWFLDLLGYAKRNWGKNHANRTILSEEDLFSGQGKKGRSREKNHVLRTGRKPTEEEMLMAPTPKDKWETKLRKKKDVGKKDRMFTLGKAQQSSHELLKAKKKKEGRAF